MVPRAGITLGTSYVNAPQGTPVKCANKTLMSVKASRVSMEEFVWTLLTGDLLFYKKSLSFLYHHVPPMGLQAPLRGMALKVEYAFFNVGCPAAGALLGGQKIRGLSPKSEAGTGGDSGWSG